MKTSWYSVEPVEPSEHIAITRSGEYMGKIIRSSEGWRWIEWDFKLRQHGLVSDAFETMQEASDDLLTAWKEQAGLPD